MKDRPSILDQGFLYGLGVFETMRTYGENFFQLDSHLDRLIKGAETIGLKLKPKPRLKNLILGAAKNNSYIKLICWQGKKNTKYAVIMNKLPKIKPYFTATISQIRQNENSPLCHVKSLNYLNFILARKPAQERNFDEALLLNSKGFLTEGTRTNLFFIKNNYLFTPSIYCGCLKGVTRKTVLEIAKKYKIKLMQGRFKKEKLFSSDEAFLTNSLIGIMPLIKINNYEINKKRIGRLTKFFQEHYKIAIKNSGKML